MIFTQRRQLLKFAAVLPLATVLSPVNALTQSGFDGLIQEIAKNEKLFIRIGEELQNSSLHKSPEIIRQQLMSDTGCTDFTEKAAVQEAILARIKDDFKNDRVVNYQGWILSKTEVNICQLAFLS